MRQKDLKQKAFMASVWSLFERTMTQGISFVVSVVLARILLPDEYGVVSIVTIFIGIVEAFTKSGLSTALIQRKEVSEKEFSSVFFCNIILSLALYLVLFLAAPYIALFYNMPILVRALRVLGVRIPIGAFNAIQYAYVSKKLQFKKFFFSTIGGTILSGILGIAMALNGFGVWALIAQGLANTTIDTTILFFTSGWHPKLHFSIKEVLPYARYGYKIMLTDLSGTIFNYFSSLLIGKKYTTEDLAYYTKGISMPRLIDDLVESTISNVSIPVLSKSDSASDSKAMARRITKLTKFVLFPVSFGMMAVATPLVTVLLTEKWLPAVPFFYFVCIGFLTVFFGSPISLQCIKAAGRSDATLKIEFIKKPIMIVITIICLFGGPVAVGISIPISDFLATIVNGLAMEKVTGYKLKEQIMDGMASFLCAAAMFFVVYGIRFLAWNAFVTLIVQAFLGISIYIGLSIAFKNESFFYTVDILHRLIERKGENT